MNSNIVSIETAPAAVRRGRQITQEQLLADLGLAGVLTCGEHLTWLLMVPTGVGQVCNDAIISWDEQGDISAAVVDRTSGEPVVTVGFEADLVETGIYRLRSTDGEGEDVLQRFGEAVAGMELADDDEQRLVG